MLKPVHRLSSGDLQAEFVPALGMVGVSLRHRGEELLGRAGELDAYVARGSTLGIPFLHPWANRLAGSRYEAAGRTVELDLDSPLLHLDGNGLPIHGVPGAKLAWEVVEREPSGLAADLEWGRADLLGVFPFPHRLRMDLRLDARGLTVATTLRPTGAGPVPISFGFHPYLRLPGAARDEWVLDLPAGQRLALDGAGIPTGARMPLAARSGALGGSAYDDGFAALDPPRLAVAGGGRRIEVSLLEGYRYAQVYAPAEGDVVALEPMTAPTNALVSGDDLRVVEPGSAFRASFRLDVEEIPGA